MSERCSLCVAYGKDGTGDGFLCCSDDSKRLLLSLSDDFVCQPPFSVICLRKYKDKVRGGSPHTKVHQLPKELHWPNEAEDRSTYFKCLLLLCEKNKQKILTFLLNQQ